VDKVDHGPPHIQMSSLVSRLVACVSGASKKEAPIKAKSTPAKKKGGSKGDTEEAILTYMADMLASGVTEVAQEALLKATKYAAPDSKGFRNPIKQLVKELEYLVKMDTTYSLTEKGVEYLKKKGKIAPEPTSLEEHQARIKEMLVKVTSKAPEAKVETIWNKLLGGKTCTQKELLGASGYKGADSSGYKNIMKQMRIMKLLDETVGKGQFKLSDKVLKFEPCC
jgi:hypothetical protein